MPYATGDRRRQHWMQTMTEVRTDLMESALAPLWMLRPPAPRDFHQHPAYAAYKSFCQDTFASADRGLGFSFGLADALRAVGLPCLTNGRAPSTLRRAAAAMTAAFEATEVRRRYLCPLDGADRLPELRFGAAAVGRHPRHELLALLDATTQRRCFPDRPIDPRLAHFQWLVVEETIPAAPTAGRRSLPHLYENWSRDFGAIEPHAGSHPGPVVDALFGLLLAPWEDWHSRDLDWRAFSIPWIHLATDDPFAPRRAVPAADALSWEDFAYPDDNGEPIEGVRPLELDLNDEAREHLAGFDHGWWARIEHARSTSLFETPVEHFLVRAALSDGMDQIMAHMTAIEAAIGLRTDFGGLKRPKGDRLKAKDRMAKRVGRLLGDPQAEVDYAALFEIRSGFVHGRAIPGSIPSGHRNSARRLARRVASALIDAANGPAGLAVRADWLNSLA